MMSKLDYEALNTLIASYDKLELPRHVVFVKALAEWHRRQKVAQAQRKQPAKVSVAEFLQLENYADNQLIKLNELCAPRQRLTEDWHEVLQQLERLSDRFMRSPGV